MRGGESDGAYCPRLRTPRTPGSWRIKNRKAVMLWCYIYNIIRVQCPLKWDRRRSSLKDRILGCLLVYDYPTVYGYSLQVS